MAINLINVITQLLGSGDTFSKLGSVIGLTPDQTKSAVSAAAPAILAGIVSMVQKPKGRDQLATAVRDQDPGLLDNLGAMLSGGQEKSFLEQGTGLLGSLFGQNTLGTLAGAVGKFTGLNQGSSTSLLGALAPVVLGTLGREQRKQELDADGLMHLLNDQKDSISSALPSDLAKELGSTGLLSGIPGLLDEGSNTVARAARSAEAASYAATSAGDQSSGGGSLLRWIIGLAILAAILWAAYQFLMGGNTQDAMERVGDSATQIEESARNLIVGDVNIGESVTGALDSATQAFSGISDAASAEAALPQLNDVMSELDRLNGLAGQLPAAGQSALADLINSALPQLESLVARASDIPGVGAIIRPTAEALLAQLRSLAS
jgi:hypothetical protein